jgi:hypothetical protein
MPSKHTPIPVVHITPKNDTYLHVFDAEGTCWCCPIKDDDDFEEITFLHLSYDRREDYEDGLRKPH